MIRGPCGDGRAAVVAQDDIADAIVAVLREPAAHAGRTYDLTGPQALTFAEMAEVVGARFHDETIEEAYASRARFGAQAWQVDAWVSTYTAVAAGEMSAVDLVIAQLTGRRPRTLAEVVG